MGEDQVQLVGVSRPGPGACRDGVRSTVATITWWDGKKIQRRTVSDGGKNLRVVPTGDGTP
ncbi:hypothetical protein ACIGJO_30365 [Streptomyces sp. NPDC079020]|uniref:hypothetical protein n=1 Tax=Streptomyces sp. NPDC079020 TaxID=3365722 RepID=UPI0037D7EC88